MSEDRGPWPDQEITIEPIRRPVCEWEDCERPAAFTVTLEPGSLVRGYAAETCGRHARSMRRELAGLVAAERWRRLRFPKE